MDHRLKNILKCLSGCLFIVSTILFLCCETVHADSQPSTYNDFYDNDSKELGDEVIKNSNGDLYVTDVINSYIDPKTCKVSTNDVITLSNQSKTNLITIKSIAIRPYIKDVDVGVWKLINVADGSVLFSGKVNDICYPDFKIRNSDSNGGLTDQAKISIEVNLKGDEAIKLANTKPSYFEYAYESEPLSAKAVLKNGILTFYYDQLSHISEGTVYKIDSYGNRSWQNAKDSTTKVVFDNTFAYFKPSTCSNWFNGFSKLTQVDNTNNLNNSNISTLEFMFYGCSGLNKVDVAPLMNLGNKVKSTECMFFHCCNIQHLNLENWDVSKIENMRSMFAECYLLSEAKVDLWNTSNCKNFGGVFCGCRCIASFPVENWNTSSATQLHWIFFDCNNLKKVDLSKWNTSICTTFDQMFAMCYSLVEAKGLNCWNTSKVTDMSGMFRQCVELPSLNLSSWNTYKVSSFTADVYGEEHGMFLSCNKLKTIIASDSFNAGNASRYTNMFLFCEVLMGGCGTRYSSSHIGKEYARIDRPGSPGYFTSSNIDEQNSLKKFAEIDQSDSSSLDPSSFDTSCFDQSSLGFYDNYLLSQTSTISNDEINSFKSKYQEFGNKDNEENFDVTTSAETKCNLTYLADEKVEEHNKSDTTADKLKSVSTKTGHSIMLISFLVVIIFVAVAVCGIKIKQKYKVKDS